jgi:hypothetical protein
LRRGTEVRAPPQERLLYAPELGSCKEDDADVAVLLHRRIGCLLRIAARTLSKMKKERYVLTSLLGNDLRAFSPCLPMQA